MRITTFNILTLKDNYHINILTYKFRRFERLVKSFPNSYPRVRRPSIFEGQTKYTLFPNRVVRGHKKGFKEIGTTWEGAKSESLNRLG